MRESLDEKLILTNNREMTKEELSSAKGLYCPGVFHLFVNIEYDLKGGINAILFDDLPPEWSSTFLHEYVHFLQDITTTFGLLNILHLVEYLRNANEVIRSSSSGKITFPTKVTTKFNWGSNEKLKQVYSGQAGEVGEATSISYDRGREVIALAQGEPLEIDTFMVKCLDQERQSWSEFLFGAIHIKEGMAHIIQREFDPSVKHDSAPYRIAKQIAENLVPEVSHNDMFLSLCSASLMHYHPAQLFFDVLERLREDKRLSFSSPEGLYNWIMVSFVPEGEKSFRSLYEKHLDLAEDAFSSAIPFSIYRDTVTWFRHLLNEAKNLRSSSPTFFSDLVKTEGVVSPKFLKLINSLGVPLTTNRNSEGVFVPPAGLEDLQILPYQLKAAHSIALVHRGSRGCSMRKLCSADEEGPEVDRTCIDSPWVRSQRDQLCPFGQLWKAWGLPHDC